MDSAWVKSLKAAKKSAIVQHGRRKIHFLLVDGTELCEEYDVKSNQLMVRKWRKKSELGGVKNWEVEIGEADRVHPSLAMGTEHLMENNANPISSRLDTKRAFQWRIRNLPYPLSVYDVKVDTNDSTVIVVRTSNRKYFKKLSVPDVKRCGLKLSPEKLSFSHANNTLVIQYQKPVEILKDEKLLVDEFRKMNVSGDGDAECKQS